MTGSRLQPHGVSGRFGFGVRSCRFGEAGSVTVTVVVVVVTGAPATVPAVDQVWRSEPARIS